MNKVYVYEDVHCEDHIPIVKDRKNPLPETPLRVQTISKALKSSSLANKLKFKTPQPATLEELLSIHKTSHIDQILESVTMATFGDCMSFVNNDADVVVTANSDTAARYAAGAVRDAVLKVIKTNRRAFCNIRPPGHHAHCHKVEGFCLYNNVWFGAQVARRYMTENKIVQNREPRIAIIDWDVHHGDGTQDFVLKNTNLATYFVSIHQSYNTQFPGTGKECRKLRNNSIIECHNIRMGEGDDAVKKYFNESLIQNLTEWFPDIILISCGFDGHTLDPIGQLEYSSELYGWMTKRLVEVSNICCNGRIVSVLEGGYSLKALEEASVFHVEALLN